LQPLDPWASDGHFLAMRIDISHLPVAHKQPDERQFWRKLGRVLAHIPFAEDLVAAWYCARDPATPAHVRALLWGAVAYFIMPVDLIPDYLVAIGFTDDAAVIAMVMTLLGRHIEPWHRDSAKARLDALRGRR
jgi:uncharacterized membrane protein YkvA (DUF1232 family)